MKDLGNLNEDGYLLVKNVLSPDILKLLTIQFTMHRDCVLIEEGFDLDDRISEIVNHSGILSQKSFHQYGIICFDSLLIFLKEKIEDIVGEKLLPLHSGARIMYNGAFMVPHKDKDKYDFVCTICIEEDEKFPYPLCLEDYNQKTVKINIHPGDMLIYDGCMLNHWREKYEGKRHIQTFISYAIDNQSNKHLIYDKRPCLGLGIEWKKIKDAVT